MLLTELQLRCLVQNRLSCRTPFFPQTKQMAQTILTGPRIGSRHGQRLVLLRLVDKANIGGIFLEVRRRTRPMVCFVNIQRGRVLRAIEAPAEMHAEFKLYLKDLRFVGDYHLSLPLES